MIFATMLITILIFVVVLSLLVFVHELGHFLVAKKMGMKVEEFGFGFPPRLFGYKRGETVYSINWIPIGGFVKIKGEDGSQKLETDSFASKKPWQRFFVLIAGVTMNFALAALLLSIGYMHGLPSVIEDSLPSRVHIEESKLSVLQVLQDSPADRAQIQTGDTIISLDGNVQTNAESARSYIAGHGPNGIDIIIQKSDKSFRTVHVISEPLKNQTSLGIGVGILQTGLVSYPFFDSIGQGVLATGRLTKDIVVSFAGLIKDLVVTQKMGVDLSGPVGIAVMTGEVAAMGWIYLLQFAAVLSINLGVINILPFPALDGGRVFFLLIEKIRGKSVNAKFETLTHNLGFMLLMLLIILVTLKDVMRFVK